MTRNRYRWLPDLRALALALFALALVLQPVMAAVGEIHEFAHGPSGAHSHALHAPGADTAGLGAHEHDQAEAEVLHLLQHFANCCGAASALLHTPNSGASMPPAGRIASVKAPMPTQIRPVTPFKPPIFM